MRAVLKKIMLSYSLSLSFSLSLSLSLSWQNFELLMTFYTPDVYNGPGEPGSCHQIAVVSDDSSSKLVY